MTNRIVQFAKDGNLISVQPKMVEFYKAELRLNPRVEITVEDQYIDINLLEPRYGAKSQNKSNEPDFGKIKKFSRRSTVRFLQALSNVSNKCKVMMTLTYPANFPTNGKVVKYHFKKFKQRLHYRGHKIIWCLEFQKRDAPHFHILSDTEIDHQELAKIWYQIVDSKDAKHLQAGTRIEPIRSARGINSYMSKYMKKKDQKIVPAGYENVGRFWGVSQGFQKRTKQTIYFDQNDFNTAHKVMATMRIMKNYSRSKYSPKSTKRKKPKLNRIRIYNSQDFVKELLEREVAPPALVVALGLSISATLEENIKSSKVKDN